jgi:hypothetical protein
LVLRSVDGRTIARLLLWGTFDAADRLLESTIYRYRVDSEHAGPVELQPDDLFESDVDSPRAGRLRTGNHVGLIELTATFEDGPPARALAEVASHRLGFDDEYRWMLSGIARDGAELLLNRYAATSLDLAPDLSHSPEALYQQLAFLGAILRRPHTVEAIERVLRAPHVDYPATTEVTRPDEGLRGGSRAIRALLSPGPRQPAPHHIRISSLPVHVRTERTHASVDSTPNRFVRAALEEWSLVVRAARTAIGDEDIAPVRRAKRDLDDLDTLIDRWRSSPMLREVGRLTSLPSNDQVLLRRPGYREVHQAFLESRAAAMLRWDDDELLRAGQRDIAALYEYWTYLELRRIVQELCDHSSSDSLVEVSPDGLHLGLRRGTARVVEGFVSRLGRLIDVELWFNRSFSPAHDSSSESSPTWTLQLRPDCSLRLAAESAAGDKVETWLHFDAKYRVTSPSDLFVDEDQPLEARRGDLLKMHAYRDAIRRSSGAYVLFPGSVERRMQEHAELLPGLGAFPLRPGSDGRATADTANPLRVFIDEVLDHVASQLTSRERASYWLERSYAEPPSTTDARFVPLPQPPADTLVLVGFYRSAAHLEWIEASGLYNLRAGDRPGAVEITSPAAAAPILVLWSAGDAPVRAWSLTDRVRVMSSDELRRRRYPFEPDGPYICRVLDEQMRDLDGLTSPALGELRGLEPFGAPVVVTWADMAATVLGAARQ